MEIRRELLKALPYVNHAELDCNDERVIQIMPFREGEFWIIPIPTPERIIMTIGGTPAASTYFAKEIDNPATDIFIPCLDFLKKYTPLRSLQYSIHALENNFDNLFTIVNKIDTYWRLKRQNMEKSDFVRSEFEYLFVVCKSIFDNLQKIISILWNKSVKLIDGTERKNLPESFRPVVMADKKIRTIDEIRNRFGLPKELAIYYSEQCEFYEKLKDIRDDIVHHDKSLDYFYSLEDGFAISSDTRLYQGFPIWDEKDGKNEHLYSVRPLLSLLINKTIFSCNEFCSAISRVIAFPNPILVGGYVFVRSPHLMAFVEMERALKTSTWWR